MLKKQDTRNLKLRMIIEETMQSLGGPQQIEVKISHCYREANQVADGLAKYATTLEEGRYFHNFQQLPGKAKGPFQLVKWQLPSFRSKYEKGNFFVS